MYINEKYHWYTNIRTFLSHEKLDQISNIPRPPNNNMLLTKLIRPASLWYHYITKLHLTKHFQADFS